MLEYADVGPEIFITSTGRVLFNQKVSRQVPAEPCRSSLYYTHACAMVCD